MRFICGSFEKLQNAQREVHPVLACSETTPEPNTVSGIRAQPIDAASGWVMSSMRGLNS